MPRLKLQVRLNRWVRRYISVPFQRNVFRAAVLRSALSVLVLAPAPVSQLVLGQALDVQPATITSSSNAFTAKVRLHLKNTGKVTLRRVSTDKFSVDGFDAVIDRSRLTTAPPGGEIEWPVTITVPTGSHLPGAIVFAANYESGKRRHYLYATLTVQSDAPAKPIEAAMDAFTDPVSEQRPGVAYVQFTNNLDVPAQITMKYTTPEELMPLNDDSLILAPRSSVAQKVELKTKRRVQPGAHAVAIDVIAKWTKNGIDERRQLTLTKPVTVGVFFESELLKALSVPSLLILPGCLVIFTMQAMLTFGFLRLKDDSRLPSLIITSPAFWMISITLSAIFIIAYWLIMNINLVLSYGAMDLVYLWIASVAFGIAAYAAIAWKTKHYRVNHVPGSEDGPLATLQKMANNKLYLKVPKVRYKLNDVEFTGLVIEKLEEKSMLWVAPKIKATFKGADAALLESSFGDLVNRGVEVSEMLTFLNTHNLEIDLSFERALTMPKLYHLKVESITGYLADGPIIGG